MGKHGRKTKPIRGVTGLSNNTSSNGTDAPSQAATEVWEFGGVIFLLNAARTEFKHAHHNPLYIYIYIRRPAERVFNYSTMEYSIRCDPHESQTPPARAKPNSFLFLFFLPGPLSLRGTLFLRRATASAECRMPVFRIQRPGRFIGETTILDLLQEMVHVIRWRSAKLINMIKQ